MEGNPRGCVGRWGRATGFAPSPRRPGSVSRLCQSEGAEGKAKARPTGEAMGQRSGGDVGSKGLRGFAAPAFPTWSTTAVPPTLPRSPRCRGRMRNNAGRRGLAAPNAPTTLPSTRPSPHPHNAGLQSSGHGRTDGQRPPEAAGRPQERDGGARAGTPPWHLPADVPAVGVELLGRALHPQPQVEAEDAPGAPHPSGAREPESQQLPSPKLLSVCPVRLSRPSGPVPPAVRPLPPTSLGFLPEETREAAPDPHVRGAAGTGRQRMPATGLLLALATPLAAETGIQGSVAPPSRGWRPPEHLSWGRPARPVPPSITLKAALANVPSNRMRHLWPPPAPTPRGHPTVLPTPGRG